MAMKYFYSFLAVILLTLFSIVMVSNSFKNSGNTNSKKTKTATKLVEYLDKNSSVSLTNSGSVVGENEYRSLRITVSRSDRTIEILNGYEYAPSQVSTYSNTPEAYNVFLLALNNAGFTKSKSSNIKDERGLCPLGRTYVYNLKENSNNVIRTWSNTCANSVTFTGNGSVVRTLFQKQIPEYGKFSAKLNI